MEKSDSSSVTFYLNNDVSLGLRKIEMDFRRKGYKKMSRTFLLNAISHNLIDLYNRKGVEEIEKIVEKDWQKWNSDTNE